MTRSASSKRPPRKANVSLVIAMLFCASVIARLGGGTAQAIANEVATLAPGAAQLDSEVYRAPSEEVNRLLSELRLRAQKLDERRDALDLREQDLKAAAMVVEQQMAQLNNAEVSLREMIALADTAAEGDITQLTSVYENMKPKEAAAIFEQMAPRFSAGFLGRMRPDAAAKIFAGLTPSTAYSISAILAGRNLDVPTR